MDLLLGQMQSTSPLDKLFNNLWLVLLVTFLFGGWIVTDVVRRIAENWRMVRQTEQLAVLKHKMVERGMSAEEIERVVAAGENQIHPTTAADEEEEEEEEEEPSSPLHRLIVNEMDADEIVNVV